MAVLTWERSFQTFSDKPLPSDKHVRWWWVRLFDSLQFVVHEAHSEFQSFILAAMRSGGVWMDDSAAKLWEENGEPIPPQPLRKVRPRARFKSNKD